MNTYVKNTALLGILSVFTLFIIIWANLVELDEMSRVQGKIIPSSKEKVIQSEFNGRLVQINVKVGDKLKKDDVIARVSDEEIIADQKCIIGGLNFAKETFKISDKRILFKAKILL